MDLPVMPPVKPMLAKPVAKIPQTGHIFEPKWDGFRAVVFRDGDKVEIGSRKVRPITRYFPELVDTFRRHLPKRCVLDGEIVIAMGDRLDFEALQQRIHPADSRVRLLSRQTPASFVAFDVLAHDDTDVRDLPMLRRRELLEDMLRHVPAPVHLTPATDDPAVAAAWFTEFEGAGLDGVIAKPSQGTYQPDKRTMLKIKHTRTADCVVAGYRVHKSGPDRIGSLLLGLYNADGDLLNVGAVGAFTQTRRIELFEELQPLVTEIADHPWSPQQQESGTRTPRNAEGSRWAQGKDMSFTPLLPQRVVEVSYDHLEGDRFRHTAQFVRWRPDRDPRTCTYAQLEEVVKYDLADVLGYRPGARLRRQVRRDQAQPELAGEAVAQPESSLFDIRACRRFQQCGKRLRQRFLGRGQQTLRIHHEPTAGCQIDPVDLIVDVWGHPQRQAQRPRAQPRLPRRVDDDRSVAPGRCPLQSVLLDIDTDKRHRCDPVRPAAHGVEVGQDVGQGHAGDGVPDGGVPQPLADDIGGAIGDFTDDEQQPLVRQPDAVRPADFCTHRYGFAGEIGDGVVGGGLCQIPETRIDAGELGALGGRGDPAVFAGGAAGCASIPDDRNGGRGFMGVGANSDRELSPGEFTGAADLPGDGLAGRCRRRGGLESGDVVGVPGRCQPFDRREGVGGSQAQ